MDKEQKLIQAILRRGSCEAANELITTYYDEIYVFVYRQVRNSDDAFDLTQEIFIAVLRSLPSYDSKKASFRTWLYHIASYKIIDARRKPHQYTIPIEDIQLQIPGDFIEDFVNRALLDKVEDYVRALDPNIQEVFRLRVYGEYSFPEIAAATSQPESKVKAQYYRLIQKLKKEFSEDV